MSIIKTLVCDRCGATANNSALAASEFVLLTARGASGRSVLPNGKDADLCGACADSLQAWFANPQQFRQLHDAAEATLLWFAAPPWTNPQRAKWTELTGADDANTKTLCDAIRKALAHPEENDDATRNT